MTAALRRRCRRSMPPCHLEAWRSLMEEARLLPPPPHHAATPALILATAVCPYCVHFLGRRHIGSSWGLICLSSPAQTNSERTNDRTQFTAGRLYMLRIVASSCCPLFLPADPLQPPPHCQSAWPRGAAVLNCRHCCRNSALGSCVGQGAVPASCWFDGNKCRGRAQDCTYLLLRARLRRGDTTVRRRCRTTDRWLYDVMSTF